MRMGRVEQQGPRILLVDDELAILDRNVYTRLTDVLVGKKAIAGPKGFKRDTKLTKEIIEVVSGAAAAE